MTEKIAGVLRNERGAVLIVGLLILVILTMLGITAMQTSTLEERMAGNLSSRELAFQAAEAGLRAGENYLASHRDKLPVFNGSGGFFQPAAPGDSGVWLTANWNSAQVYSGDLSGVAEQPRFIIEQMSSPGATLIADSAVSTQGFYRITSRGVGGTANSVVILQETYLLK